jgi:hypothetical protein
MDPMAVLAVAPLQTAPVFLQAPLGFQGVRWVKTDCPCAAMVAAR